MTRQQPDNDDPVIIWGVYRKSPLETIIWLPCLLHTVCVFAKTFSLSWFWRSQYHICLYHIHLCQIWETTSGFIFLCNQISLIIQDVQKQGLRRTQKLRQSANWKVNLRICELAQASNKENWPVQLVRPASLSSWSVQLVCPAGPSS